MSDDTTPQDSAAMPPASAGSRGSASRWDGVPVAWAAVGKNGVPMWLAYHRQDAEGAVVGMAEVVPLYRSPALTDAEREAVAFMLRHAAVAADGWAFADSADYRRHHDALFGLLERNTPQRGTR